MSSAENINTNDSAIVKIDDDNSGEATLRRRASSAEINENEGRILLRQIDDAGKTLLTTYYALRKNNNNTSTVTQPEKQQQQQRNGSCCNLSGDNSASIGTGIGMMSLTNCALPTTDEDAQSFTTSTTTSDVNSNDDATSIVSRMSQIVVEQEEKLFSPTKVDLHHTVQKSVDDNNRKVTNSLQAPNWPVSRPVGRLCNKINKTVSSTFVPGEQPKKFSSTSDKPSCSKRKGAEREPAEDEPTVNAILGAPRLRAKSEVDQKKRDEFTSSLHQNESFGFLPERGTLRALELNRKISNVNINGGIQAVPAASKLQQVDYQQLDAGDEHLLNVRSRRIGSFDGQTMLNIQRSTWTLSEFDETFIRQPAYQLNSENNSQLIGVAGLGDINNDINSRALTQTYSLNSAQQDGLLASMKETEQANLQINRTHTSSPDKPPSAGNLLMLASKNNAFSSLVNNQQLTPTLPSANGHLVSEYNQQPLQQQQYQQYPLDEFGRRRFSVVSFASSYDSSLNSLNKRKLKSGMSTKKNKHLYGSSDEKDNSDDNLKGKAFSTRVVSSYNTVKRYLPVLEWLPAYKRSQFAGDLMAGLVVATLNISISLSAAVVAETDPGTAFRASIISTFVYSLLCSSKHTSFGSWSIMSQMMVVSVKRALSDELLLDRLNIGPSASWLPLEYERWHLNIIVMYTFLIGLVQLISGILNLGNILASFIPEALGSSLIAATAFTMAIGQLANMCGTSNKILWSIEKNTTALWADLKNPPVDITDLFAGLFRWVKQIVLLIKYHEQINIICVAISVVSVILLFINQCFIQKQLESFFKRKILIPCEVIIVILMIVISYFIGLKENYNVATCGAIHIDFGVPNLPNLKLIRELWFESLATALISYSMVYVMSKTYGNKLNYDVEYNQELIACGAGNLIGGLFDALPATASFSRTAAKVEAGCNTQMASLINCIVLLILAHFLGHYIIFLPVCVTSAALFYGFVRMMAGFKKVFVYWRICKVDFSIWMFNFIAILTLDLVNGFVYGFIFSILTMLYRAQNRRCYMLGSIGSSDVYVPLVKYPLAQQIDGIKIFQFCGPIHYVCAELFERLLRQKTRVNVKQITSDIMKKQPNEGKFNPRDLNLPTHIILDFSMISYIDTAGINIIKKIIEDYQKISITILIASLASHVASMVKSDSDLWNNYHDRFYITLADAVHCASRDRRIQETDMNVKT